MAATGTEAQRAAAPAAGRHRTRAFGLEIESTFEAPGLPPASGPASGPATTLELAAPAELDRDWPADAERLLEERFDDGPPARTIDNHPLHGYRLYARHFGLARIAVDGSRVVCAPPADEAWSWQRFLVGRVLPWASLLRGFEVLHASAVSIGGRAVAFVGPTGAGKTSLAVRMFARGAGFVTDDVLALDRDQSGGLRAHPGACIASVRPEERAAIPAAIWSTLGTVLGESGKTYVALPRVEHALPLGAVCFLERGEGSAFEPIAGADPRLLLSSTFVVGVQTPQRLLNQLDVCAALARDVPLYRVRVDTHGGAEALAATVLDRLAP
jgi:hypothetical protein